MRPTVLTAVTVAANILLGATACSDTPQAGTVNPPLTANPDPIASQTTPQTTPTDELDNEPTTPTAEPDPTTPQGTPDRQTGDESSTRPSDPPEATPRESEEHAFIRRYFDLVSQAQRTGDTGPMLELSSSDCASCNSVGQTIEELHEAGGQRDVDWVVSEINDQDEDGQFLVLIEFDEHEYVPSAGAQPTPVAAEPYVLALELAGRGESWTVAAYARIDD